METIISTLSSASFLEKALLLVAGAILTGMLVPIVKARMDQTTFEKRKLFEAALTRQNDVIKAQTKFLAEFSKQIWEYHKISQRVSYYRLSGDVDAYNRALAVYQDSLWESLQEIRSSIGAARWFTSDMAHEALSSWYEEWFVRLEIRLRELIQRNANRQEWSEHHTSVHREAGERNYTLLRYLAEDFGLLSSVRDATLGKPAAARARADRNNAI